MGEPTEKQKKQWLSRYIALNMRVENQLERLARLRNEAKIPAMKESDGSQRTGGASDRMANAAIRAIEYEEHITPQIKKARAEMAAIVNAIESLDNPLEAELLDLRYINGNHCRLLPWREIAFIMYGDDDENSMQNVYRLHGRALKHLKIATSGNEDG